MTAPVLARPDRRPQAEGAYFGDGRGFGSSPQIRDDLGLADGSATAARTAEPATSGEALPYSPWEGPAHLRVVRRRGLLDIGRRRARVAVTATVGLLLAVAFGLVGLHVMIEQNQLRLDRLQNQSAADALTYQRLRLRVDQLQSPARIVAEAEGILGMVTPATLTYLAPVNLAGESAPVDNHGGRLPAGKSIRAPDRDAAAGDDGDDDDDDQLHRVRGEGAGREHRLARYQIHAGR